MKKIIPWIIVMSIIGGLSWVSYHYFMTQQSFEQNAAYNCVPENSPFVFEIKNLHELTTITGYRNKIHEALKAISSYNLFTDKLFKLDTALFTDQLVKTFFDEQPVLITAGITGKNKFDFLYLIGFSKQEYMDAGVSFIRNYFGTTDGWEERDYDNNRIFYSGKTQNQIFYATVNGTLIISPNNKLVESALQQSNRQSLIVTDPEFTEIMRTAGKNALANLYINHVQLPGFLSLFIDKNFSNTFGKLDSYSSWSEFDISIKDQELFLNGFSLSNNIQSYLHVFNGQKPVAINVVSVLPANTSTFLAMGISDVDAFRKGYRSFQGFNNLSSQYLDELSALKEKCKIDIEDEIYGLIDQEIVLAFTKINSNDPFKNSFLIMKTHSQSQALNTLTEIMGAFIKKPKTIENYIYKHRFDDEMKHNIYKMPFANLGELLFGRLFGNTETQYFTFVENYLIFGSSKKSLGDFIDDNLLHKNLANDFDYLEFSSQTADKCNLFFYSSPATSLSLYPVLFNEPIKSGIENNAGIYQDFHAFSFQFSPNSNRQMVYNDIYLKYGPLDTDKPRTRWELRLDTTFTFKPKFVLNHYTGNREIFIQDDNNKIYLINYAGRILWQKQLDQAIMGDVHQIDYYKNNKLQLLFNTKNKLHLIDRLGNYVERYPVNLSSPATNGIGVIDYNNKKDYRIFIACQNKRVFLYSIEGNIIKGWKFKHSEHAVSNQVQHFISKNKDYIVFNDENKSYILNRRGKERVKPEIDFAISKNGKYIFEDRNSGNDARMIITGPDGTIYFVYLDGKVESLKIHDFSNNHFFDYRDVDGDKLKDFIFVDGKKLEVYNLIQTKLIDLQFDQEIEHRPISYIFPGNSRKLGIVAHKRNEIFLINSDGSLYQGFPLLGHTLFSIGSITGNQKFNLFVGTNDNFLYNYEIE